MELLNATSNDGTAHVAVAPYVSENGKPGVAVFVKKGIDGLVEGLLDGAPAFVIKLTEDGTGNGPWTIGHELAEAWEKARKMAEEKTHKGV